MSRERRTRVPARSLVSESTAESIGLLRLRNQGIAVAPAAANAPAATNAPATTTSPASVVQRLGAMQGQDYLGALWSIGLRVPGSTESDVEAAFERRELVRTWPMRGTLHVIPAKDARWMLELLTPRVLASTATRRANLALDDDVFAVATTVFTDALRGGNRLSRDEMMASLERAGISTTGQRGYHILFHLSMRRLIVFGPRTEAQQTFVLFDEWLPDAESLPTDEALARLVHTYFTSHAPATVKDFAGWSGLTIADTKRGLAANHDTLVAEKIAGIEYWMSQSTLEALPEAVSSASMEGEGGVFLLPGFDEFVLGYKDRTAILAPEHGQRIVPGNNGMFKPTVLSGGRVAGIWRRVVKKRVLTVEATPLNRFTAAEKRRIVSAAERYRAFLGADDVEVTFAS